MENVSNAEWQARVDLAALYRLVDLHGWSDLLGSHISHRVPGEPDRFLLNPYGFLWEEMTASMMLKVDYDGTVLTESNHKINPAGFTIHSAIMAARPDVTCAIHTHTQPSVGVSTQKDGLLPLTQHALHVIAHAGYYTYGGIETDPRERDRIKAAVGHYNVLFLRNHGLIAMGRTPGEAFMWCYRAERACRMQLAIQQAGAETVPLPDEVIAETVERNRFLNSAEGYRPIGVNEWPALLRKLDRMDPSYKT
ncbi:MAG: class aldolase [Rhodospirillales bacterium]|nr:class aldolase [Rhodospirillales bacterium]